MFIEIMLTVNHAIGEKQFEDLIFSILKYCLNIVRLYSLEKNDQMMMMMMNLFSIVHILDIKTYYP